MTFDPLLWQRPKEDPASRRATPLGGAGLRVQPPERAEPARVFALVAGIGVPILIMLTLLGWRLAHAPLPVRAFAAATAVGVAAFVGVRAARVRRRRRAARAEREARRAGGRPGPAPAR